VLDVHRGEHVDPCVEHVGDVLVALQVLQTRGVRVGQLVDEAELGPAREEAGEVHLLERRAPVGDAPPGHDLQPGRERGRLLPPVSLEQSDDHVASRLRLRLSLLEHPVGLPDAGGHPEEDLVVADAVARHVRARSGSPHPRRCG
jgi:hypothetical protein